MIIVTTSHEVQGKRITANDGVVSSWTWFDPDGDDAAQQEAWEAALNKIMKQARFMNANAIIDLAVSYTPCGKDGKLMLNMIGSAVSLGSE